LNCLLRTAEFQAAQTIADFGSDFFYAHAFLRHQPAGEGSASRCILSQIKRHPAVLAIFIPAEASIGNVFRRKVLQAAQQKIVLRNFQFPAHDSDFYEALKWVEECSRGSHPGKILIAAAVGQYTPKSLGGLATEPRSWPNERDAVWPDGPCVDAQHVPAS
jgi:hypothetical protein